VIRVQTVSAAKVQKDLRTGECWVVAKLEPARRPDEKGIPEDKLPPK
jgi:hypothetical protein